MIRTTLVGLRTNSRKLIAGLTCAVLSSCLVFSSTSYAQVIIDGDGFESVGLPPTGSGYSTTYAPGGGLPVGSLEGQHASLPGDFTTTPWVASFGTDSTAVIQTSVTNGGTQALEVSRSPGDSPSFWGVPVTAWPDSARYICIEWDMRVELPVGVSSDGGPYFGVDAIDDAAISGSDFGLLGSMGVLSATGEVVYTDDELELQPTGASVVPGTWNHFHMDLDFELKQYTLYLNDPTLSSPLITAPFPGLDLIGDGAALEDFSDAPIGTFATDADLDATAYFDNYIVYQLNVKIPEPATAALGLIAMVSVTTLTRRRK